MPKLNRIYFGTQTQLKTGTETTDYNFSYGFESTNDPDGFYNVVWSENPPGWERVESDGNILPHSGGWMAASVPPPHTEVAGMEVNFNIPVGAENAVIEFWLLANAERNEVLSGNGWYALYDYLSVSHNGSVLYRFRWCDPDTTRTELANWDPGSPPQVAASGTQGEGRGCPYGSWFNLKFSLGPGTHQFVFDIVRDGGDGEGNVLGTGRHYVDSFAVTYNAAAGKVITEPSEPLIHFDGSEGFHLARQLEGGLMPPINHIEYSLPFQAGSVYDYSSVEPRDFSLGLFVRADENEDIRAKMRKLASKLALKNGALFADFVDGERRELPCRLSDIDQQENPSTQGAGNVFKTLLTFRAFDPFWYSQLKSLEITPSQGQVAISNHGDYETWPIFHVFGPLTNPTISLFDPNDTVNPVHQIKLNTTLAIDKIISIDARPGYKTITLDDGTNLYNTLDVASDQMFAIPPGDWLLQINSDDSGTSTKLTTYWREAYWGL